MARLLILTIVLIIYGSLYPWHLRALPPGQNPFAILIHSWPHYPVSLLIRDAAVNVIVYLPLGFFAFATFSSIWRSLLLGFALSTFAELSQVFIVSRVPSLLDITTNTVGSALGVSVALWWTRTKHKHAQHPDVSLLVACWILYQCFPFLPQRPSVTISFHAQDILLFLGEAVALIILAKSRATVLLPIVPLKAFIYTRTLELSEVACYLVARLKPIRPRPAAVLLGGAILVHGLAPFHFAGTPHAFSWVPFGASFTAEWEPALTIMLGKIFRYGALVWLIRESGVRLLYATIGTAAFLAAIEIVQLYLPGRSSEITDPMLALILGWVFWSLRNQMTTSRA